MKVGIIGAGAWGTALGVVSARGGADVVLWSYDGEYKAFEGVDMPQNLAVSRDMADMENMDAWLIVTPAAFFRETMKNAQKYYKNQPIIICTKGAEPTTGAFMSEVLAEVLPSAEHVGVLSGPQFAAEVARGIPTGSTIAGDEIARGAGHEILNKLYLSDSDDIVGVQMCGVGKNAVALIAGYNFVASAGENERAMIFTRAWAEVANIGRKMGAKSETFLDLCGVGDLFLSATSETSRNFSGGMAIARGAEMVGTVEGVSALRGLIARAEKLGVPTPILCAMRDKMGL
jgi:glycerol-3-phosphate dehydrogenase (NAD(P)+)